MPDKLTGKPKILMVKDSGDEIMRIYTEFRRMVSCAVSMR